MRKKIVTLEEMIFVQTDGSSRESCLSSLTDYLKSIHVEAEKFFFIEAYMNGNVVGAMALAKVDNEPEHNKDFPTYTMKEGPYLLIDVPYTSLQDDTINDEMDDIKVYQRSRLQIK